MKTSTLIVASVGLLQIIGCKPRTASNTAEPAMTPQAPIVGENRIVNCINENNISVFDVSFITDGTLAVTQLKLTALVNYMEQEGTATLVAAAPYKMNNPDDVATLVASEGSVVQLTLKNGTTKQFPFKNVSISDANHSEGMAYLFIDDSEQNNQDVVLIQGKSCKFENTQLLSKLPSK